MVAVKHNLHYLLVQYYLASWIQLQLQFGTFIFTSINYMCKMINVDRPQNLRKSYFMCILFQPLSLIQFFAKHDIRNMLWEINELLDVFLLCIRFIVLSMSMLKLFSWWQSSNKYFTISKYIYFFVK